MMKQRLSSVCSSSSRRLLFTKSLSYSSIPYYRTSVLWIHPQSNALRNSKNLSLLNSRNSFGSFNPFSDDEQSIFSPNNININNEKTIPTEMSSSRTKLRVADTLKSNEETKLFTIPQEATISDAIAHLVQERISSTLVINKKDGSIVGIFTARDLLKAIVEYQNHYHPSSPAVCPAHTSISDFFPQHVAFSNQLVEYINRTQITEIMTGRDRLVYCSPNDSLSRCREIMFQCRIRNLPIIDANEGNKVKGILTMKTIADSSFSLMEIGGKKGFIHNVTGRRGLPNTAKVDLSDPEINKGHSTKASLGSIGVPQIDMELGLFALPHPFKSEKGVSNTRRDYGAFELSSDLQYCEDAFFAVRLKEISNNNNNNNSNPSDIPNTNPENNPNNLHIDSGDGGDGMNQFELPLSIVPDPSQVYFCVADGVGSWRQYGIDPREYSHK
jgi:CBS domain-containing protein